MRLKTIYEETQDFSGLPKGWKEILPEDEFPFLYKQLAKCPDLANDEIQIIHDNGKVVAIVCWRPNAYDFIFTVDTLHMMHVEVAATESGRGQFRQIMTNLPSANITLQANTDRLVSTYEKFGFQLLGDKKKTGNFMVNFDTTGKIKPEALPE
jgi:hypothetical protein